MISIPSLLHHPLSLLLPTKCPMPRTAHAEPQSMGKIRIHSPYCHARLPQYRTKLQYVYKSRPQDSSASLKTGPPTLQESPSPIPTSPLPASSTTLTKKTLHPPYQRFHVLISLFKHLAEHVKQFPSQTTLMPTAPLSPPSPESTIPLIMEKSMLGTLNKSSELPETSTTVVRPVKMTKRQLLLHSSTGFDAWNLQVPLYHHLPFTTPFRHLPYRATLKSQRVPRPLEPESALWPADQLRPSNSIPKVRGVQGLKLTKWEQEYHLFHQAFMLELSCCLLAQQEELKHHLP